MDNYPDSLGPFYEGFRTAPRLCPGCGNQATRFLPGEKFAMIDLFQDRAFLAHTGDVLPFKIECDALSEWSLTTLAKIVAGQFKFSEVYGIPTGGERLADALRPFCQPEVNTLLIVDDVLTTGASFREAKEKNLWKDYDSIVGTVIFSRGRPCCVPFWVVPIFQLTEDFII